MNRKHSTNRKVVIVSALSGVVLFGAAGFAAAAKGDAHPPREPTTVTANSVDDATSTSNAPAVTVTSIDDKGADVTNANSIDDHGTDATTANSIDDNGADDATETSVDDATSTSVDDNGVDATSTSVDDNGADDATSTSVDDHGHGGNGGHGSDD